MTTREEGHGQATRNLIAEHIRRYEETGDIYSGPVPGMPTVILSTVGRRSGILRKTPVVRIKHGNTYCVVASDGGAERHPAWYLNLRARPEITLRDGHDLLELAAREVVGPDRHDWWERACEVWPAYREYQTSTVRTIPVVILRPIGTGR